MFEYRPVPKTRHKRGKKTQRQRGRITKKVYAEAYSRSGGRCERCGRHESHVWTLEAAHVERRWKSPQEGITAVDILMLCGPSTDSRTCHHWADYTREGREWMLKKREENRKKMMDKLLAAQENDVKEMDEIINAVASGADPDAAAAAVIGGEFRLSETTKRALTN